jgi:hypothetical protein
VTYEEAKRICEEDNMAIIAFDNPAEINKISDYMHYIGAHIK